MRVKICGITQAEQGIAIAKLGANTLGFICVEKSPRYVTPKQIKATIEQIPKFVKHIGVFVDSSLKIIEETVENTGLTGIQLHGNESPLFCRQLRHHLPHIEIIKALRIKTSDCLTQANFYSDDVDTILLDAYHPQLQGGTGKTLDWESLSKFRPHIPWLLAGGLTPVNIIEALEKVNPDGIDLSSGLERSPGDKDLEKVALLFDVLKNTIRKTTQQRKDTKCQ